MSGYPGFRDQYGKISDIDGIDPLRRLKIEEEIRKEEFKET